MLYVIYLCVYSNCKCLQFHICICNCPCISTYVNKLHVYVTTQRTLGGFAIQECQELIIMVFLFPYSLKVEYDKLANEKTEMQRHYVMVRARCGLFFLSEVFYLLIFCSSENINRVTSQLSELVFSIHYPYLLCDSICIDCTGGSVLRL